MKSTYIPEKLQGKKLFSYFIWWIGETVCLYLLGILLLSHLNIKLVFKLKLRSVFFHAFGGGVVKNVSKLE